MLNHVKPLSMVLNPPTNSLKSSYGYGSIPINTIFSGMNIHLPAILMFTRGTRFWHCHIYIIHNLSYFFPNLKFDVAHIRRQGEAQPGDVLGAQGAGLGGSGIPGAFMANVIGI